MKRLSFYSILLMILLTVTFDFHQAIAGYALNCNLNRRELVQIPETDVLDIEGQAITIEVWINTPTPQNASMTILNKENSYEIQLNQGNFQFAVRTNGGWAWEGSGRVNANEWTHVACTYDGQNVRNYINGENSSTVRRNGNIEPSDDDLYFATRPLRDFTLNFNGMIDDVRIWNVVRTEDEIQERMNSMLSGDEEGLVGYWRLDEGEGQVVHDQTPNGSDGHLGFSPDEEEQIDPDWVESEAPIWGGELELSHDAVEFGPNAQGEAPEFDLKLINISEDDDGFHTIDFTISDLGEAPNWLDIDPVEGEIEVGDTVSVVLLIDTEDMDYGEYERSIMIESNSVNLQRAVIPVSIFVVEGFGQLSGRVISAQDDRPVEGATVTVEGSDATIDTDENGNYGFEELAVWQYDVVVSHPDFLTQREDDVDVSLNDETTVDFSLLYSEFSPNPEQIEMTLAPDDTLAYTLIVDNVGNGPLSWSAELVLPDQNVEPWTVVESIAVGEIINDDRLRAVEFVDDHYYITGGDFNDENINRIYVVSREGELVRSFPQFTDSRYGIRDLTWDGELLWGGDVDTIYGFTLDGELRERIEVPVNPARCIAWDAEHAVFWVTDITAHIYSVNREGEVMQRIDRPDGLRKYGLSWFPNDPDGFNLYLATSGGEFPLEYHKINTETDEIRLAADLSGIEGASEGGFSINTRFDPLNWVLINYMDDNESVNAIMLKPRSEWITADPLAGIADVNDASEITIRFATTDFPIGTELEAELTFSHDGRGAEVVPINVNISDDGGLAQRLLPLGFGWNLISANIIPAEENLTDVLAQLVQNDALVIAKNGVGQFYVPGQFDNIGAWNSSDGYWLKLRQDAFLRINGEMLPADTPLQVEDGWNLISYVPRVAVEAPMALSGLGESLVIAKDGVGGFYIRAWNFSNLTMREGRGYQLKVDGDHELIYQVGDRVASTNRYYSATDIRWINELEPLEVSYSLLIVTDGLSSCTRLESYDMSGSVIGRGVVGSDGRCGMSLWGVSDAQNIRVTTHDAKELSLDWIEDDDGWGVARSSVPLPTRLHLSGAYPNPFNSSTIIRYELPSASEVRLEVFDLSGRKVATLVNERVEAGHHDMQWDATNHAAGVYFTRLEANGGSSVRKLVLVK